MVVGGTPHAHRSTTISYRTAGRVKRDIAALVLVSVSDSWLLANRLPCAGAGLALGPWVFDARRSVLPSRQTNRQTNRNRQTEMGGRVGGWRVESSQCASICRCACACECEITSQPAGSGTPGDGRYMETLVGTGTWPRPAYRANPTVNQLRRSPGSPVRRLEAGAGWLVGSQ